MTVLCCDFKQPQVAEIGDSLMVMRQAPSSFWSEDKRTARAGNLRKYSEVS
jgi:hypothetical protein